jgi:hypothetical protein
LLWERGEVVLKLALMMRDAGEVRRKKSNPSVGDINSTS